MLDDEHTTENNQKQIRAAEFSRNSWQCLEGLFSDGQTSTNSDETAYSYDIAGNLATLSCCQLKTLEYSSDTGYAFPVSETKGTSPQLTSSVVYNKYTGLITSSTDENNIVTDYQYKQSTLRQKQTDYANGGYTKTEYSDVLEAGNSTNQLIGFVKTTTLLETGKTTVGYGYFDGRGAMLRNATQVPGGRWSISATEYDKFGRTAKSYNPFYAAAPNGAVAPGTAFTTVTGYDALGRATEVELQDGTKVKTDFTDQYTTPAGFNKTYVTVTDQAGKQRRQVMDSFGRIVRVDEPDATGGVLGAVDAPVQPTSYEYDGNDNLIKTTQTDGATTQIRQFKYDALSRLTHEKQVEATATLDDNGVKQTSGGLWTKVLKYSPKGLVPEGTDARGVKTTFAYDGLNRVVGV